MKKLFRSKKNSTGTETPKTSHHIRKHDPLYIIFEKHLYDFNYDSRERFIHGVVEEYINYLGSQKVFAPPSWRLHLEKTISEEVTDMLVRKLYGCLNVEEFKEKEEEKEDFHSTQKSVRKRYYKLVG